MQNVSMGQVTKSNTYHLLMDFPVGSQNMVSGNAKRSSIEGLNGYTYLLKLIKFLD